MSNFFWGFILMVAGLTGLFFAGFGIGGHTQTLNWQDEIIERGYALHCPDTGDFAWKGECGDE